MFDAFDSTFLTNLKDEATAILSQISPVVALVVGILLAFFIIKILVNMIRGKRNLDDNGDEDIDDYEGDFDEEEY